MSKTVIYNVGKVLHTLKGETIITGWSVHTDNIIPIVKDNQTIIWGFHIEVLELISEVFHKKYKKQ